MKGGLSPGTQILELFGQAGRELVLPRQNVDLLGDRREEVAISVEHGWPGPVDAALLVLTEPAGLDALNLEAELRPAGDLVRGDVFLAAGLTMRRHCRSSGSRAGTGGDWPCWKSQHAYLLVSRHPIL